MAKDKKGFIVYTSWKNAVTDMSDEEAGQFFKWMLDYTNDKWNSTQDVEYPDNRFVKQMCKMVMPILKEDLKKYERKVENFKRIGKQFQNNGAEIDTDNGTENEPKSVPYENLYGGDKDKVIVKVKDKDKDKDKVVLKENTNVKEKRDGTAPLSDFQKAINDFITMRNKIKKPLTELAKTRMLNKLENLSNGDEKKKIAILNQSTDHCWQDIYELKQNLIIQTEQKNQESDLIIDDETKKELEGLEL